MSYQSRGAGRSAVLDTNLVLLLLVAQVDLSLLRRYKRVQMFTDRDISLLRRVLEPFTAILTTPHVLTEVSNFLGQAPPETRARLRRVFADYVLARQEIYSSSAELANIGTFFQLGLTDCALEEASLEHTVITMDYRLAGKIHAMGRLALNFNHARSGYLV